MKKIEKKYRNPKRPLQRVALTAMWMKLFTGKGRFVKRTPLTDIVMSLFGTVAAVMCPCFSCLTHPCR